MVGVDVFIEWTGTPDALAETLVALSADAPLGLKMISNRGTMVYPSRGAAPAVVDHYRCRFTARGPDGTTDQDILALVARIGSGHRWMHLEKLQSFDGVAGYTRAQSEDAA